jgi:hypothetical protein
LHCKATVEKPRVNDLSLVLPHTGHFGLAITPSSADDVSSNDVNREMLPFDVNLDRFPSFAERFLE